MPGSSIFIPEAGQWIKYGRSGSTPPPIPFPPGFNSLVLDEQWVGTTFDTSRWSATPYLNSHFDSTGHRIQTYQLANIIVGPGTSGANGNSIKMRSIEIDNGSGTLPDASGPGTRYSYTGAMLDSKSTSTWYPRYNRIEARCKIPHGQGIWPALWYTAKVNGATMCEVDWIEYFASQIPGHNKLSVHGTDNTGTYHINRVQLYNNMFFEAPTYTPGWHTWACEIVPVTDATGNTLGDPHLPSNYVKFTEYLEGVNVGSWVDTSATTWTTNGGTEDSFWNVYFQGAQIDGDYVGHPEDPQLGWSHWRQACLISGSSGSCATVWSGNPVIRAHFTPPAADFEVDYIKIWKFTG